MGTVEIFIVFSALMALIALVTIGIDWIGKPLKHRRFIARIYRFDDEKLPTDEYGHTTLEPAPAARPVAPVVYVPPAPVVVAHVPTMTPPALPILDAASAEQDIAEPNPTIQMAPAASSSAFSTTIEEGQARAAGSAFSSSLDAKPDDQPGPADSGEWHVAGLVPAGSSLIAEGAGPDADSATAWKPGDALDVLVDGQKPSLSTKAERFWKDTAASLGNDSHFDATEIERMQSGKAPRRTNPRTGRQESMRLTGLRQASQPDQVSMQWPEDSIDPWSST